MHQVLEQNAALTVKDGTDPLLLMKGMKNEMELAHTKQAHIRDAVAMVRFQMELESRLAAGETLTELTVDEILHKYRSADDKFLVESFGTIAAYGGNAAMMHYHATPEDHAVLEKKGFLLVDSGATYMDGTTDITRTYPLGALTEDEKRFYTWTLQSHIDLARAVWLDYCECKMIDTIAREPLWRHLINYRCGTGHSVSFVGNVHEGPHALNSRNTTRMRPGMVVTDEPGVYETDLVGIRIENELVCIHKADNQYGTFLGFEPLTFVPIATSPILPGVLDKDELAWLNDYHRQVFAKLAPHLNDGRAQSGWRRSVPPSAAEPDKRKKHPDAVQRQSRCVALRKAARRGACGYSRSQPAAVRLRGVQRRQGELVFAKGRNAEWRPGSPGRCQVRCRCSRYRSITRRRSRKDVGGGHSGVGDALAVLQVVIADVRDGNGGAHIAQIFGVEQLILRKQFFAGNGGCASGRRSRR